MYESPIQLIETQMRTEIENEIFRAIKEVGVDVNKDELIKALRYERNQYSKGYKDGYDDGLAKVNEIAEQIKMAFYYEFDELIPSIMADKIDEIVKNMR